MSASAISDAGSERERARAFFLGTVMRVVPDNGRTGG